MPPKEAGYTYAVEPSAIDRLLANEEESIYDVQIAWINFGSRHTADVKDKPLLVLMYNASSPEVRRFIYQ
jgi:hypothetical protein